jgi:hypothetical protein
MKTTSENLNTNMTEQSIIINGDFTQRKDRLVLKSLLTWVTLRFANVQGRKFEGKDLRHCHQLSLLDQMKKIAVVSESDAWIMEKNSALYSKVARAFMKEFLNDELYSSYGEVLFSTDRHTRISTVALIPPSRSGKLQEVAPCSMFIMDDAEIIEKYKENDQLIHDKYVDIVPLLNIMISTLLTPQHNAIIDRLYDKFKDDPEVIEMRDKVEAKRAVEEDNLAKVLSAINVQGSRVNLAKLAIVLHTIIKSSYNNGPNLISKLRFESNGETTPVIEYTRGFVIPFVESLEPIKEILEPLISNEIKIKVSGDKIIFTTGIATPDDMEGHIVGNITSEDTLDYMFNNHVAPTVSIDEVTKVMNRVLYQKYKSEYY